MSRSCWKSSGHFPLHWNQNPSGPSVGAPATPLSTSPTFLLECTVLVSLLSFLHVPQKHCAWSSLWHLYILFLWQRFFVQFAQLCTQASHESVSLGTLSITMPLYQVAIAVSTMFFIICHSLDSHLQSIEECLAHSINLINIYWNLECLLR